IFASPLLSYIPHVMHCHLPSFPTRRSSDLLDFIRYKAARAGVQVLEEDPRHTSQRCSRCGHTERKNRQAQAVFHCQACGYTLHRSEEHTSELQSRVDLVCRLLLEKKKIKQT